MNEVNKPWVHDLLQIDPALLTSGCGAEPHWIQETLIVCPWVVVRRAQTSFGRIAVGVRGATRSERWAAFCDGSQVRTTVRPEQLLASSCRTSALRTLLEVRERWAALALSWWPAGSVGFELASGRRVTTEASDLDLVIRGAMLNTPILAPDAVDAMRKEMEVNVFGMASIFRRLLRFSLRTETARLSICFQW